MTMRFGEKRPTRFGEVLRRAFVEFLTIPTLIIGGFFLLAVVMHVLDGAAISFLDPLRALLHEQVFRNSNATSGLLGTIAGSLITVTSITFSLLLLAVQQSAATMTSQVYDQFLRRRMNQVYFGFFVGLSLYTLLVLATITETFNPVLGASVALVLTVGALYFVILLLYTTIDQMRPAVIVDTIHSHIRLARGRHRAFLGKTRRASRSRGTRRHVVRAGTHGFVVQMDPDALAAAAAMLPEGSEIILRVAVGKAVVFEDVIAELKTDAPPGDADEVCKAVQTAIPIEEQRDLDSDPAYGIEQLTLIGWTSISTAKSDPAPALFVIHSLHALLACWVAEEREPTPEGDLAVVYADDVTGHLFDAFESLAVSASESMQHQTSATILEVFAAILDRLPDDQQRRVEDIVMRLLPAMGDHVLTTRLDCAVARLSDAFEKIGRPNAVSKVVTARNALAASIGKLGSRATRVTGAS